LTGIFHTMRASAKQRAQLRRGIRSRREGLLRGDLRRPVRDTLADTSVRRGRSLRQGGWDNAESHPGFLY
jgi:hypothetical protein